MNRSTALKAGALLFHFQQLQLNSLALIDPFSPPASALIKKIMPNEEKRPEEKYKIYMEFDNKSYFRIKFNTDADKISTSKALTNYYTGLQQFVCILSEAPKQQAVFLLYLHL